MKRAYRITIVIEREFQRKATREAKGDCARFVHILNASSVWKVVSSRITNRAKPERIPRTRPEPNPASVFEEIGQGQALAELREIAADVGRLLGNVKKPRVEFAPNRWCKGGFSYIVAHTHTHDARWSRNPEFAGERAGRKIPKGLICINRRKIVRYPHERWAWLMAHEVMHIRMPGGSHRRAKFETGAALLLSRYYESKGLPPDTFARLEERRRNQPRSVYRCPACKAQSLPFDDFEICPVCFARRIESGIVGTWQGGIVTYKEGSA